MPERHSLDQPIRNAGESMADVGRDVGRTASQAADEARHMAAERLGSAASAIDDRTDQLPGGPGVKRFARAAAERLGTTAEYVRSHDAKRMLSDVERVVKANPGPSLAIAAVFGFIVGRALTRE